MNKRSRFILILVVLAVCALFLRPSVKWYFGTPDEIQKVALSSLEKIKDESEKKAREEVALVKEMANKDANASLDKSYSYVVKAAKKAYKVIVSDRAKQMLGMHIRFIAQISKEAARKKKKQLTEAIRSLAFMPQRYPFFENPYIPHGKYHKMYVESWYLVLYQIKDDRVEVDYIVDCRQDYEWLL